MRTATATATCDKSDGEYEFNGRKLLSTGCELRKLSRIRQRQQAVNEASDCADSQESTDEPSSTQHPPGPAQPSGKPPRQKMAKIEKQ